MESKEMSANVNTAPLHLSAGLVAGAANTFTGFPFDTLKVRLQAERGVYRNAFQCLWHILRYEGLSRGLYRGLSPPLIGGALETGINYFVFHRTLELFRELNPVAHEVSLWEVAASAGVAGVCLSPVLGPFELIKCRMQVAKGSRFKNPLECFKWTIQCEGILGLTRGIGATMIREAPGNSIFFTSYELLRRNLPGRAEHSMKLDRTFWEVLADATSAIICGGVAGTFMWLCVLPLDVAKTRLQAAYIGEKYNVRITRQLQMLWSEGKWRALYSGLGPTMIRAFPANAAQWLTWELVIDQLNKLRQPK